MTDRPVTDPSGGDTTAAPGLTHRQAVEVALSDPAARSSLAAHPVVSAAGQRYAEAAAGVLADLAAVGFQVSSVSELNQGGRTYQAAVPILLDWLPRVVYLSLAEDIVRTLSVAFARRAVMPAFLGLFRDPPEVSDPSRPPTGEPAKEHLRWVIGNGLGILGGPPAADELIELSLDRSYGKARTEIVANLPKTKDERVPSVLIGLLDDPTVAAYAIEALGRLRLAGAREPVEKLLSSTDGNIRAQARKALKRLP